MHFFVCTALWLSAWALSLTACAHRPSAKERETARISYDVGITAFQRGDGREALRALLSATRSDPNLPEAHHALGLVYHANGKEELALAHYQRALLLRPTFSEARNNCGVLLLDMGHYDGAIAAFESALADMLYATPVLAEGNLGWALYKKGDVIAAREHLTAALASDANFCRGYQWLMHIASDLDDAPEALSLAKKSAKHCSDNPTMAHPINAEFHHDIDHMAAMSHLRLGHTEQALQLLRGCAGANADEVTDAAQQRCRASLRALQSGGSR